MPKNSFYKMNGNGNDFIIIFTSDIKNHEINKSFITKLADRQNGIGCDQLILLSDCNNADIKMVIYNHDGSEGLACGNATRCVAWLMAKDLSKNNITIKTTNRILECKVNGTEVSVNMGKPLFSNKDVGYIGDCDNGYIEFDDEKLDKGYFVNVGNNHLIFFVDDINKISAKADLAEYESHPLFPNRINVSAVHLEGSEVKQITYERGAGETLSCGTAACAVFAICQRYKDVKNALTIHQAGGTLKLSSNDNGDIIMTGDTTFEYVDALPNF